MPKWLKCTIEKGMFSDEMTIIVQTRTGETVSVFVPKESTQVAPGGIGQVKVHVAETSGHTMAVLPDEHQSVVDVDASALIPA
jgi:hypothetical protein